MPHESGYSEDQCPEQRLDRAQPIVLERQRWIDLSHQRRLGFERTSLDGNNRPLQVTLNPLGSREIESHSVEIRQRGDLTHLRDRDPLRRSAVE